MSTDILDLRPKLFFDLKVLSEPEIFSVINWARNASSNNKYLNS